jgi:sigma-B regulation protein RsbU (phosphoserine phosphatase)
MRGQQELQADVEVRSQALQATGRGVAIAGCEDPSLPLQFVNAAYEGMTGYAAEEVVGRPLFFMGTPSEGASLEEIVAAVVELREPRTITLLQARKDSTAFWNEMSLSPVVDETGEVTHVVAVQHDVSERETDKRRLEIGYTAERRALQDSLAERRLLEAVLEEMPSGVMIIEVPSGRLIRSNVHACQVLGSAARERTIAGVWKDWQSLHPDGTPYTEADRPSARAARGEVVEEEQVIVEHAGGRRVTLLVRAAPVHDDVGVTIASVLVVDDITERVDTEQRLVDERERSVDLADTLQRGLLPSTLPEADWLEFGSAYLPMTDGLDVGGDFYDVFERSDGQWVIAIGDVMGKGADAATVTSMARHAIRTASLATDDPRSMLSTLNQALLSEGTDRPFCTVALGVLRRTGTGGRLSLCLGGHPRPFLLRVDGGVEAVGSSGTLLGVMSDVDLHEIDVDVAPGEALVFYTDGVSEAQTDEGLLGDDGVQRILEERAEISSSSELAGAVQGDVVRRGGRLRDDAAVVVVRVLPTGV